ncbi:TetR/AcrR family transcriptional regulator [Rugosimonospora africana]|uniref:TetR family transcriptional regulator n=1 Tax=Rugosimonospora africana TaxID=556532 RepID=A0A8J3QWB9_9ACTN|nr:TetR/AcrR family transcriptional regulator [Rugosimonospora africana]GIH18319.1 TetR family transcriptional regulator [Rugosimonospora africana]
MAPPTEPAQSSETSEPAQQAQPSEPAQQAQPSEPTRPLRSDAQRNRELLLAAACDMFAEQGLDVAMADIARRAGVSNGTLYNRFPTRSDLIEAVFVDRLERMVELARHALAVDDPWDGLEYYLTGTCELQAADRGFNEVATRGLTSPAARRLRDEGLAAITELFDRAQRAGTLRADVTVADLAFVVWGISRTVDMTAKLAPRLWRRHLALLLDGFRAQGAHPLPEPPLAAEQTHPPAP